MTATLLAVLCSFHVASGVIHSWKAFYTGITGLSEFPEFVAVNILDDEVMGYFDNRINRFESKQSWMTGALGQQYDEQQTDVLRPWVDTFKNNVKIAMDRFNQSQGVHTFQCMYGCQWDDESGDIDTSDQYGYDGEDFLTLDLKNLRYIAPNPQAVITKQKWDNNRAWLEAVKAYGTQECINWLKKYVQYGSSTLGRTVPPEVTLLQKNSGVVCHSTGFYPDGVMITLKRDGVDMHEDVDMGETLPNEDGTFQKRAELKVSPEERKKGEFTCEVAHKSGEPIVKILIVEEGSNLVGIIIGCVIAAVVVIGGVVAVVFFMKKEGVI
uniref:MHC class I antigen 1B n=1 Tax=Clupea pallasii TaxID=30724 RepID=G9ICX1_CLUPA|nr:MHC class I antigen 1B [Clupea pallasii]